jgi:hypothetical protein
MTLRRIWPSFEQETCFVESPSRIASDGTILTTPTGVASLTADVASLDLTASKSAEDDSDLNCY